MISKKGIAFIFLLLLNLSYSQSQISEKADLNTIIDTTVIELQDYKNVILFGNYSAMLKQLVLTVDDYQTG